MIDVLWGWSPPESCFQSRVLVDEDAANVVTCGIFGRQRLLGKHVYYTGVKMYFATDWQIQQSLRGERPSSGTRLALGVR